MRVQELGRTDIAPWVRPDTKTQVTIDANGKINRIVIAEILSADFELMHGIGAEASRPSSPEFFLPISQVFAGECEIPPAWLNLPSGGSPPTSLEFVNELRPLLFLRELYMYDFSAVQESIGAGYWAYDGQFLNDLRG